MIVKDGEELQLDTGTGPSLPWRHGETAKLKQLVDLVSDILVIPAKDVQPRATFVALGGDSFTALNLFRRCMNHGMNLPYTRILSSPLQDLAETATTQSTLQDCQVIRPPADSRFPLAEDYDVDAVLQTLAKAGISDHELEDVYPCSPMQENMYVGQHIGGARLYQTSSLFEVDGRRGGFDVDNIRLTWQRILDRHQSLRTTYAGVADLVPGRCLLAAVLKHKVAELRVQECADEDDARRMFRAQDLADYEHTYHRLCVYTSQGRVRWLQVDISHIMVDGGSLIILMDELQRGLLGDDITASAPGYDRYINYLQTGADSTSTMDYWINYLENTKTCHFPKLIQGVAGSGADQLGGSFQVVDVPLDTYNITLSSLRSSCRKQNATIFNALQTAWALVLHIYSGLPDVCFGYLSSGRALPIPGVNEIVGPIMNLLVCRVDGIDTRTLVSLLGTIRDDVAAALNHQCFVLRDVQKILGLGETKLFNSIVTCYYSPLSLLAGDGGCFRLLQSRNASDFDLVLKASYTDTQLNLRLAYSSKVLSPISAKSIANTLASILSKMELSMGADDSRLSSSPAVAVLGGPSLEDLERVFAWNNQTLTSPAASPDMIPDACVHWLVEEQARLRPEAAAVDAWDGLLSYRELNAHADLLVRHMARFSGVVVPESRFVALCFEKSKWYSVALLGVLKSGSAFVPLDLSNPVARMQTMLFAVGITPDSGTIVCSMDQAARCRPLAKHVIVLDDRLMVASTASPAPAAVIPRKPQPDDPAYVIFTSGSSGTPKGVEIKHKSYAFAARAHREAIAIGHNSRVLQFASYGFDTSMEDHLTTLACGACICVPSEAQRADLRELGAFAAAARANWAHLTPSLVESLTPELAPSIDTMVLGGEAVTGGNVRTWAAPPARRLIQVYGPSECCVTSTASGDLGPGSDPTNIGRALPGCAAWVVRQDDPDSLCAVGAVGELLMEGPILAEGYVNYDSGRAFVRGLKWAPEKRLYRTGDLVRQAADGLLHFVGRRDGHALKIRGQRIEPREIEKHLVMEPSVRHGLVLAPASGPSAGKLIGVVSLGEHEGGGGRADVVLAAEFSWSTHVHRICDFLLDRLPSYMIPEVWIILDYIPVNSSAKLDRRKLMSYLEGMTAQEFAKLVARMDGTDDDMATEREATNDEEQMRSIWSRVLNLDPNDIPLDTSFFAFGGDSISAMVVSNLARENGIEVSAADVLRGRTIERIVAAMTDKKQEPLYLVRAEDGDESGSFSLSPIQRLSLKITGGLLDAMNQQTLVLRVKSQFEQVRLEEGLVGLVRRHPMLRARFSQCRNGEWEQKIMPATESSKSIRLRFHSRADTEYILDCVADARRAIDINHGPLIAADIFEGDQDHGKSSISLTASHLVVDTVSWRVMLQELEGFLLRGTTIPDERTTFRTWCKAQVEYLGKDSAGNTAKVVLPGPVPKADLEDWGLSGKSNCFGDMVTRRLQLDPDSCSRIIQLSPGREQGMTSLICAAVVASFLQTFGRQPSLFVENHGRTVFAPGLDPSSTVGWFTTFSPLYVVQNADQDIRSLSRQINNMLTSEPLDGLSYFSSSIIPLPMEMTLNYLGAFQQVESADAVFSRCDDGLNDQLAQLRRRQRAGSERYALISILAVQRDGGLDVDVEWNSKMKGQDMIKRWISSLEESLEQAVVTSAATRLPRCFAMDNRNMESVVDALETNCGLLRENIESIYPCGPMQTGLVLSQLRNPSGVYSQQFILKIDSTNGVPVDPEMLLKAWRTLVDMHPILRTIFFEDPRYTTDQPFLQAVLKTVEPVVGILKCQNEEEVMTMVAREEHRKPSSCPFDIQPMHSLQLLQVQDGMLYLVLRKNHLLTDGITSRLLFSDLADAYNGFLPQSRPPFYRYIEHVWSQDFHKNEAYWQRYLSGVNGCTFPKLRQISDGQVGSMFIRVHSTMNKEQLGRGTRRLDVTTLVIFQAAWSLALRSFSNVDEVVFGVLCSGRDLPIDGAHEILGPMANVLPISAVLSADTSIYDLCQHLQRDNVNHMDHQTVPIAALQHSLKGGSGKLFNTVLNIQKNSRAVVATPSEGIRWKLLFAEDTSEYDVAISVTEQADSCAVNIETPAAFMTEEQAQGLLQVFISAVGTICDKGDLNVGRIGLSTEHDHQLLFNWHQANKLELQERCIPNVILETAAKVPLRTAISSWDGELTYADLVLHSGCLASQLLHLGVSNGRVVVLCFEKSLWAVVAMLAVTRAGGVFVFIDPDCPEKRAAQIIQQTGACLAVASSAQRGRLSALVKTVVEVDKAWAGTATQPTPDMVVKIDPSQPAYMVFTSGTTGTPKGVVIPHRAFCSAAFHNRAHLRIGPDSRVLQFTNYTFDACLEETLTVLMAGGCICTPSDVDRLSNIPGFVARHSVNWAALTPSFLRTLDPADVEATLGFVTVHAEPMTQALVDLWAARIPAVCPSYGPTECSVTSTVGAPFRPGRDCGSDNIGFPVGCRAWVVDPGDHGILVPVGAVGELLLDGPIVGDGYLGDAEQTAAAFVEPPAWARGGARLLCGHDDRCYCWVHTRKLYKTGDMVRFAEDGSLVFLGRRGDGWRQVKVRGQRVELREVQHHVDSAAQVRHGLVLFPRTGLLQGRLVAVVSLAEVEGLSPGVDGRPIRLVQDADGVRQKVEKLIAHMVDRVPSYMVPEKWLVVEGLPVQVSHKIDRKAVQEWVATIDQASLDDAASLLAPPAVAAEDQADSLSSLEENMRAIWAKVLGMDSSRISPLHPFFSIGGDSIHAIQVVRACIQQNIMITTQDVLGNRSIRQLANIATKASPIPDQGLGMISQHPKLYSAEPRTLTTLANKLGINEHDILDAVVCSPLQERMLNAFLGKPQRPYLFSSLALLPEMQQTWDNLPGSATTVDLLVKAWQKVVDRHSILRTIFTTDPGDDSFYQVILDSHKAQTKIFDVEDEEEAQKTAELRLKVMRSTMIRAKSPPHSITLFVTPSSQIYLHLTMFHAIVDHVTLGCFFHEWTAFYHHLLSASQPDSEPSNKLAEPVSFDTYIRQLPYQNRPRSNKWWKEALQGTKPCIIPPDLHPTPQDENAHALGAVDFETPPIQHLLEYCRTTQVTLATLLQFAWALVLHRRTGLDAVCFGHLSSDRSDPAGGGEAVAGPALSLLVSRALVGQGGTLVDAMRRLHSHNMRAMEERVYDMGAVMGELSAGSGDGGAVLFNTLFNYRKVGFKGDAGGGKGHRSVWTKDPHEQHIVISFNDGTFVLDGKITYYECLHTPLTIQAIVDEYVRVLGCLTSQDINATRDDLFSDMSR